MEGRNERMEEMALGMRMAGERVGRNSTLERGRMVHVGLGMRGG
jgi:hypothetical protein